MISLFSRGTAGAASTLDAIGKALAIIEFDLNGKIKWANENFCRTLGYSLGDIKGRHHSMFVEPSFAKSPEYSAFWDKLGRGEFQAQEFRRIAKGGKVVWMQASYNPVVSKSGRVTRIVKIATDITAAKLKAVDDEGKIQPSVGRRLLSSLRRTAPSSRRTRISCRSSATNWTRSKDSITESSLTPPTQIPPIICDSGSV